MTFQAPPGVFDIIPDDQREPWHNCHLWQQVEETIHATAKDYGYQEIRTPVFERTELFQRSVGSTSDIVSKEMYTFVDKGERSLSLRPEGTAPVIRAFIEHQMQAQATTHKLYYIAPMFRYERSQAGRYRQHHQFGAEAIGYDSPYQDAEMIDMLYTLYSRLGLKNLNLSLNSLGSVESRHAYREAFCNFLRTYLPKLSADSQNRFEHNPLRILDSKDPADREILKGAPSMLDFLDAESQDHLNELQRLLDQLKISWTISPQLVRGLDYYNKTVFEITAGELGAQNSIGGGGRYDGLMKQLGGPNLPTFGFGTGLERIIQTMLKQEGAVVKAPERLTVYLIPLGEEAQRTCFDILHELRKSGIPASMEFGNRKLSKAMHTANQLQAKYVVVVGEQELKSQEVDVKEMATGDVLKAPLHSLPRILEIESKSVEFLNLWKEMAKPFTETKEAHYFITRLNRSIDATKHLADALGDAAAMLKDWKIIS